MNETQNEQTIWTVEDCARFLKVTPTALYSLTRNRGQVRSTVPIPCFKLHNKALRFIRADVENWISQLAAQGRAR
jgi:predicted DNA-binding transcriptional regulator AlpA